MKYEEPPAGSWIPEEWTIEDVLRWLIATNDMEDVEYVLEELKTEDLTEVTCPHCGAETCLREIGRYLHLPPKLTMLCGHCGNTFWVITEHVSGVGKDALYRAIATNHIERRN